MTARIVPDDEAGRAEAVATLRGGGIVALPTDTVYGIAVALETPGGIERLFAAKHRPPDKGIALLLDDAAQAAAAGIMTPAAAALAAAAWPGGLTIVVAQRPDVVWPAVLTGGAATIGLRVPDHAAPRAVARSVGPLPTTSANVSGTARGGRCRGHRRRARRRHRPRARWRAGARRTGVDRGRLLRRAPGDPAPRRPLGGRGGRDPRSGRGGARHRVSASRAIGDAPRPPASRSVGR